MASRDGGGAAGDDAYSRRRRRRRAVTAISANRRGLGGRLHGDLLATSRRLQGDHRATTKDFEERRGKADRRQTIRQTNLQGEQTSIGLQRETYLTFTSERHRRDSKVRRRLDSATRIVRRGSSLRATRIQRRATQISTSNLYKLCRGPTLHVGGNMGSATSPST